MSDALTLSMPLFDLRAPKLLSAAQRKKTPVAFDIGPNGRPFPVSYLADHVWHVYPYLTADNLSDSDKKLDWRIEMPDGKLTDPKYAPLLSASQDFLWSLFADPIEGMERASHRTLKHKLDLMTPLLRWMVAKGINRFADLAGRTMDYLPAARMKETGQRTAAPITVSKRLALLEQLYLQRAKLLDALQRHPWPHETAGSLAGLKKCGAGRNKTAPLPDAIADMVGEKALDYVLYRSERILTAYETMTLAGEARAREVAEMDIEESTKVSYICAARVAAARATGYDGAEALTIETNRLRTACYIVIDLFSGVRDSELLGFSTNCIARRRSRDDTVDTIWLHGEIIKGGRRPKAWQVTESVVASIDALTRLTEPLRTRLAEELAELEQRIAQSFGKGKEMLVSRYNKAKRQQEKLFLTVCAQKGNQVAVISGSYMCNALKKFCADLGIRGEDGAPLELKSSDFRPTYARMVARSEMGDPVTLREHFGHRYIGTTLGYFGDAPDSWDVDEDLMQMVDAAKNDRQEEIMGDLLTTNAPLANGSQFLGAWRNVVKTAKNKEALIQQFAGALTLNGTGHSWCVSAATGKSCGGFCVLEAKMCVDCNYGIISEEHRPVWEGIKFQQEEALALGDLGIPGIARAKEIHEVAVKVLSRLDGHPDPSPIRLYHYGEVGKIGETKAVTELTVIPDGKIMEPPHARS